MQAKCGVVIEGSAATELQNKYILRIETKIRKKKTKESEREKPANKTTTSFSNFRL